MYREGAADCRVEICRTLGKTLGFLHADHIQEKTEPEESTTRLQILLVEFWGWALVRPRRLMGGLWIITKIFGNTVTIAKMNSIKMYGDVAFFVCDINYPPLSSYESLGYQNAFEMRQQNRQEWRTNCARHNNLMHSKITKCKKTRLDTLFGGHTLH